VQFLVVDEADRMLDLGFSDDLAEINQLTIDRKQTMMFSATFAPRIQQLAARVMREPQRVSIDNPQEKHVNIKQVLYWADNAQHKRKLLDHWLRDTGINQAIVFASTQIECDGLANDLQQDGFDAVALHGALSQGLRNRRLMALRQGQVQILVATDVAARGIDVPTITHVFNFGLPMKAEDYTHRIGRTGRAGKSGTALSLVTRGDEKYLADIEKLTHKKIDWVEGHTLADLSEDGGEADTDRGNRFGRNRRGERGRGSERSADRPQRDRGQPDPRRARQERPTRSEDQAPDVMPQPSDEGLAAVAQKPARRERPSGQDYPPRHDRNGPRERRPYRQEDNDPPVLGLGDHVPSFLLRPVSVRSAKPKASSAEPKTTSSDD
jgi:superfamily II DNA/RNA helicase